MQPCEEDNLSFIYVAVELWKSSFKKKKLNHHSLVAFSGQQQSSGS